MKYFVLGAFSSAFFLYGVALVYGATGSTNPGGDRRPTSRRRLAVQRGVAGRHRPSCSSVSDSRWRRCRSSGGPLTCTRGRPPPATGFMAAVAKTAGFAALLRIFLSALPTQAENVAAPGLGARRADHGRRVGAGRGPGRRQAHARLLVDQPRRLRPARPAGGGSQPVGRERHPQRVAGRPVLPLRLHVHGARQLRRGRRRRRHRRRPPPLEPTGAWPGAAADARRWPSPCCCWARPASRSRPGSSPSSTSSARWWPTGGPRDYVLGVMAMLAAAVSMYFYLRIMLAMYLVRARPTEPDDAGAGRIGVASATTRYAAAAPSQGAGNDGGRCRPAWPVTFVLGVATRACSSTSSDRATLLFYRMRSGGGRVVALRAPFTRLSQRVRFPAQLPHGGRCSRARPACSWGHARSEPAAPAPPADRRRSSSPTRAGWTR